MNISSALGIIPVNDRSHLHAIGVCADKIVYLQGFAFSPHATSDTSAPGSPMALLHSADVSQKEEDTMHMLSPSHGFDLLHGLALEPIRINLQCP